MVHIKTSSHAKSQQLVSLIQNFTLSQLNWKNLMWSFKNYSETVFFRILIRKSARRKHDIGSSCFTMNNKQGWKRKREMKCQTEQPLIFISSNEAFFIFILLSDFSADSRFFSEKVVTVEQSLKFDVIHLYIKKILNWISKILNWKN